MHSNQGCDRAAAVGGDPVELLMRWTTFGGEWAVVGWNGAEVTIALCRCDGGEEVDRFSSADRSLVDYVRRH